MTYVVDAKHRWQRVSEQFRTEREAIDRLAELERIGFVGSVTHLASHGSIAQSMLDVIAERRIAAELSLRNMQDDARKRLGASDPVGEISQSLGRTGMAEFGGQTLEAILRHILSECYKRDLSISNADKRIDHLEKELNAERKRYRKMAKKMRRIIRRMDTRPK